MKTAIAIGMFGCALAAIGGGCKGGASGSDGKDNDAYLKVQLVGTWVREFENEPAIYEKTFKEDGTVVLKEFRKAGDAAPPRGAEVRYHRRFGNLPLHEQTAGTWDIRDGRIYYNLALPDGTKMPQQYKVERITASEFVQSSQGVDDKVAESYMRVKARPTAATSPASRKP